MTEPTVIFEDDALLVIDKPAGRVCHPSSHPDRPALVEWVRERGLPTPHLVNRLDRETSGLVLIAKTKPAAVALGQQMQRRAIDKEYIAIVWNTVAEASGVIEAPIGRATDSTVFTRRAIDRAAGEAAVTRYTVVERLSGFTVLRLIPATGRTHQLRVHLSARGFPIVGDKIYGPAERWYLQFIETGVTAEALAELLLPRQALHAERIEFTHPGSGERLALRAEWPADLQAFIEDHR